MRTIQQLGLVGIRLLLFGALAFVVAAVLPGRAEAQTERVRDKLYVDPERGRDKYSGSRQRPVRSISGAVAKLPDPLTQSVTIELTPGRYATTGRQGMPDDVLELMIRMRPGVTVTIIGRPDTDGKLPTLAWEGGRAMIDAREGDWWLENVQIGTFSKRQRRGVMVAPARRTSRSRTSRSGCVV